MPLKAGQTVLFQGTGGVSSIGLQLAKAAGATTIITLSSDEKLKFVQDKLGADHVINYKTQPNWAVEANKITQGRGVDLFSRPAALKRSCRESKRSRSVVPSLLSPAKQEDMPDLTGPLLDKECIIRGIAVGSQELLRDLLGVVSEHNIQHKTFGFSRDEVLEA
ncbi:hypothetical protein PF008_g26974 [Phytophthora fragariae]|uniref:Alcohol dehydrogenase-like C-terminal domain-containing protein n=1 Tax=Phytophthora fragariae TaxID=53985 RepID=A0A6G0QG79_9STRA|nr:hypothetical protein PF008_g26974 [Phytophthora fragariae]